VLELNHVVVVDSPSLALKDERGIFELISPLGDVILVTCAPGLEMGVPEHVAFDPNKRRMDHCWEIRKIAELPDGSAASNPPQL